MYTNLMKKIPGNSHSKVCLKEYWVLIIGFTNDIVYTFTHFYVRYMFSTKCVSKCFVYDIQTSILILCDFTHKTSID